MDCTGSLGTFCICLWHEPTSVVLCPSRKTTMPHCPVKNKTYHLLDLEKIFESFRNKSVTFLGCFWIGEPHRFRARRDQGFHPILGVINVWVLLGLQHHSAAQYADCHDVQLLPIYFCKIRQVSSSLDCTNFPFLNKSQDPIILIFIKLPSLNKLNLEQK